MSKKILFTLMSLTVVLSMLLAACAPTATQAPQATEPAAPEVTEAPVEATEPPAVEPTEPPAEATEPPAAEPTEPPADTGAIKIGFLAGVQDPFYFTMQRGAAQAAADLGVELVVQIPDDWNATVQTPMLEAMVARGDLDFLFLAPVDKEAMVAPLQAAYDAGLPLLTNDTFIGDGDYLNGPVTFPLSYIGSDNVLGGEIACNALAEAIGGTGKVYIQNVKPGISTTDQREEGCKNALANYPDIELVGVDYNEDDPSKAQAQTEATLQRDARPGRHLRHQRLLRPGRRHRGPEPGPRRPGLRGGLRRHRDRHRAAARRRGRYGHRPETL